MPRRALRGAGAAFVLSGALLAAPSLAEAKTFVAPITDPAGDAKVDARDILSGRIAYNRKSGALSATVDVAADFADVRDDAIVYIILSDLVDGRCHKVSLTIGGLLSDPAVPLAWKGSGAPKKKYLGTGVLEGATYKMRVKAKGLAGITPGCTAIALVSTGEDATLFDDTDIRNGFR